MLTTTQCTSQIARLANDIDAFNKDLSVHEASDSLLEKLSSEERRRADQFTGREDAMRWMATRSWVRTRIAAELNCDAANIHFLTEEQGKPRIASSTLQCSWSHSGTLAVLAISRSHRIGIDVEVRRHIKRAESKLQMCLSAYEQYHAGDEADELPEDKLLRYWTYKESLAKAIGVGIRNDAIQFEIATRPKLHPYAIYGDTRAADRWKIADLSSPAALIAIAWQPI
ncbi:MAG: 4'-phosphopantetheinyl transferase superfamily protein [Pirellulales bacterium]